MPHREDLPFLLKLLEDESPVVKTQVWEALRSFGPRLDQEVIPFLIGMEPEIVEKVREVCETLRSDEFAATWLEWLDMEDEKEALEYVLIRLVLFENGSVAYSIPSILDNLAAEFHRAGIPATAANLMEFLFQRKGFRSPGLDDPNNPHDNLLFVLKNHQGSQIALSCLAILVGKRLGINLGGINIQGNFMAISFENENMAMFNSFNMGKPLARASIMYIEEAFRRNQLAPFQLKAKVHEIVTQVLKNAIDSHQKKNKPQEVKQYISLYRELLHELKTRNMVG
ncbi:MAG: transglutaminase family protein [Bacteroidia bacterium]|nr:transglutaminase family protein [Bacteroidia bacterium]